MGNLRAEQPSARAHRIGLGSRSVTVLLGDDGSCPGVVGAMVSSRQGDGAARSRPGHACAAQEGVK